MSGNRMYLVCQHCPTAADALLLAHRAGSDVQYSSSASQAKTDKWLARHQKCGEGCDKFTIAYEIAKDWDHSPPAQDTPAGAVRMALVNGSSETH